MVFLRFEIHTTFPSKLVALHCAFSDYISINAFLVRQEVMNIFGHVVRGKRVFVIVQIIGR